MIQNNFILNFLLNRESNDSEILSVANIDRISQTACAMANQQGGTIIVGASESGNVVGLSENEIDSISVALLSKVSPSLPFVTSVISRGEKNVLVITIWEGGNKPYSTGGTFYVRSGGRVLSMNQSQMKQVFLQRQAQEDNWERECVYDASVDEDVDTNVLDRFGQVLNENGKIKELPTAHVILSKLGFLRSDNLTKAAVVVTCKQPSSFLPQTRIRISIFDEKRELVEVKLIDCNLVHAVDQIVDFISGLYPKKMEILGLERRELESMPRIALREGILNAVVHRDYANFRSFVRVNVYADSLEIINSGDLMNGITIEDLKREHSSFLRNPDIANAFYLLRYIEAAGTGTMRIVEECRNNNCAIPFWTAENGCVKLVFPVRRSISLVQNNMPRLVENLAQDATVKKALNNILDYLSEHKFAKNKEISAFLNKSYASTKRYMVILKDAGLIEYQGSLKTGGWCLVSQ